MNLQTPIQCPEKNEARFSGDVIAGYKGDTAPHISCPVGRTEEAPKRIGGGGYFPGEPNVDDESKRARCDIPRIVLCFAP